MKRSIAALATTTLAVSLGVGAGLLPAASAATPEASGPTKADGALKPLAKSAAHLMITPAGKLRLESVTAAAATAPAGAVTFVNSYLDGPITVKETLALGGVTIGDITLVAGGFSSPQILPPGTYTVVATNPMGVALGSPTPLIVTAGSDISEVLSPAVAPTPQSAAGARTQSAAVAPTTLSQIFADNVLAVPRGGSAISFRNTSPRFGPLDLYVNATKVVSNLAFGQGAADVVVPSGADDLTVVQAGQAITTKLFASRANLAPDSYVPLYSVQSDKIPVSPFNVAGFSVNDTPFLQGYQFAASDGGVFNYGSYSFQGSEGGKRLNKPVVGGAESPDGFGYYLAAADGGVFTEGPIPFKGSLGSIKLIAPVVGIATTVGLDGDPGYLLAAADGGVFAFNTPFFGSLGGARLASAVVGIIADPLTGAYALAEANGTVVAFARSGTGGGTSATTAPPAPRLVAPIVGITSTPDGQGFWLVAADGGVFAEGDAPFVGSAGGTRINKPAVGLFPSYDGLGYSVVAQDGGVFNYGSARFFGSQGGRPLNKPVVGSVNP